MASVEQRIDRLERVLGSEHCICTGKVPFVFYGLDWTEERLRRETEAVWCAPCTASGLGRSSFPRSVEICERVSV